MSSKAKSTQPLTPAPVETIEVRTRNPKYHSMAVESLLGVEAAHKAVVRSFKAGAEWVTFYRLGDGRRVVLREDRQALTIAVAVCPEPQFAAALAEMDGRVAAAEEAAKAAKAAAVTPEPTPAAEAAPAQA